MAQRIQIEMADKPKGTGTVVRNFSDDTVVPITMKQCAIRPEDIGPALEYINERCGKDPGDLMYLLGAILGE